MLHFEIVFSCVITINYDKFFFIFTITFIKGDFLFSLIKFHKFSTVSKKITDITKTSKLVAGNHSVPTRAQFQPDQIQEPFTDQR